MVNREELSVENIINESKKVKAIHTRKNENISELMSLLFPILYRAHSRKSCSWKIKVKFGEKLLKSSREARL
jgi:hypothetical protein